MRLMLIEGFRNEVISSLVEMARQENTPNDRANIAFVMGKIAKNIGDAGVKALVDKGVVEALVAMLL